MGELAGTVALTARLARLSDAPEVIVTAPEQALPAFSDLSDRVFATTVPPETPARIRAFCDEWGPRALIWNGGALRPVMLRTLMGLRLPATLMNARIGQILSPRGRWMPGALRKAVAGFDTIFTADGATATRLVRAGLPRDRVEATGPILEEPVPLPYDQNEFTVMAEALDTRPVWYAASVEHSEIAQMAEAQRLASRKNHRLILVLTPRDLDRGGQAAEILRAAGLSVGVRSAGDDPLEEHQAYVADLPREDGLWYRVAPLSFIGGSFGGGGAVSPFDPILLGSAILHGTELSPQDHRFARLARSQASREVRSAAELGVAVGDLSSPDQSARMAMAGWEEMTRHAQILNRITDWAIEASLHGEVTR